MAGGVAWCRKNGVRLAPLQDSDGYHCPPCRRFVSREDLYAGLMEAREEHTMLFERSTDTRSPKYDKALRGAMSIPTGDAGAVTIAREE